MTIKVGDKVRFKKRELEQNSDYVNGPTCEVCGDSHDFGYFKNQVLTVIETDSIYLQFLNPAGHHAGWLYKHRFELYPKTNIPIKKIKFAV